MADLNVSTPPTYHYEQKESEVTKNEERAVKNILRLSHPNQDFWVHKIDKGVFSVGKTRVSLFCNEKGEVIINPSLIRGDNEKDSSLRGEWQNAFYHIGLQAGFQERDDPSTQKLTLYDIRGKEQRIIPEDSKEYFLAWKEINFFFQRMRMVFLLEDTSPTVEKERLRIVHWAETGVKNGDMRINDLIYLSSKSRGYLKLDNFSKLLPFARNSLIDQIGDPRWERSMHPITKRIPDVVTQVELDQYRQLNLIDANLYSQAIKKLADIERARQVKSSQAESKAKETRKKIEAMRK